MSSELGKTRLQLAVLVAGLILGAVGMAAEEAYSAAGSLTLSPASGRLAFSAKRGDGGRSVLVLGEDGIVAARSDDALPGDEMHVPFQWMPDGERLLIGRFPSARARVEAGEPPFDLIAWSVVDGHTESLSGGRGDVSMGGTVLGPDSVLLHADADQGDAGGLYCYRRAEGRWQKHLVLADTAKWRWLRCPWARDTGEDLPLVVGSTDVADVHENALWEVLVPAEGEPQMRMIEGSTEVIDAMDVAPDGSMLAMLRMPQSAAAGPRLSLVPMHESLGEPSQVACGRNVRGVAFSPRGDRLLLWSPGGVGPPLLGLSAQLTVLEPAAGTLSQVPVPRLPADDPDALLIDAAWLSDEALVLSYSEYGIARLNVDDASVELLWKEAADEQ
jgi:hypothetical protein